MNYLALRNEIYNDPDNLGYWHPDVTTTVPESIVDNGDGTTTTIPATTTTVEGARKTHAEIIALMNAVDTVDPYTKKREQGKIPLDALLTFSGSGLYGRMKAIAENPAHQLYSVALVFLDMFKLPSIQNFALDLPGNQQLVGACVAMGVLTTDEAAQLALLAEEPVSRAKYLFGQDITHDDVERAL